jgi:PBP1b-binding outer membrane lipoprotein LpoB
MGIAAEESYVYIWVYNWGMATKSTEQMNSLYTFTDVRTMTQTLIDRWWVDPRVAYLYMWDANVEIIPQLTKTLEEYAVAKLAAKSTRRTCQRIITSCNEKAIAAQWSSQGVTLQGYSINI